jgi:hypothetical protein
MTSDIAAVEQEATEAVGENRQALAEELRKINQEQDYSEAAKERYASEATARASERHSEIVEKHESATASTLENNEKRVFRLSYPEDAVSATQQEAYRSSYRAASFHCLNLPEADLERMMGRAEKIGDRILSQALYHEAVERGVFSVANQYREKHPKAREAWETYAQARRVSESNEALLGRALLSKVSPGPEARR